MAATATLSWTGDSIDESYNGTKVVKSLQQKWHVIDADENAVLTASGLPIYNQEFTPGSPYRVRRRNPKRIGPFTWEVQVDYGIPDQGQYGDPAPNPLDRPMRFTMGYREVEITKDQDANKRPIKNSAGTYFDPPPTTTITVETMEIRRYEAFYNRDKARLYRNHVNNNQFTIGSTVILPYECKCTYIGPTSEIEVGAPYVEMLYAFELNFEARADPTISGNPFDFHIVDQGTRAWYNDGTNNRLGFLCAYQTDSGSSTDVVVQVLTEPTPLNGKGKPIDTTIKVTDREDGKGKVYTPIENPTTAEHIDTAAGYLSPFDLPTLRMWLYANLPEADFSQILV